MKEKRRYFTGNFDCLVNYKTTPEAKFERNQTKKQLKAYLRGDVFYLGKNTDGNLQYLPVPQKWEDMKK